MNYKECNVSAEGFPIPDFDFDSTDAVIPISSFSSYSYEFDTTDEFVNLIEAIEKNNLELILKYLCVFKASVMDNVDNLPELLFREYSVPQTLMNLIDPYNYLPILYEALCTAIAWTGAQNRDTEVFNNDKFIYFLIETAVYALSDQKFTGDRRTGNAAIGLLRNLVNNSENIRISFIKMDGIKLFSSLYLEITDPKIKDYILWILQNSLNVGSEPPYDLLKDVEIILRYSFCFLMKGVTQSEIRIAIAYVKCGPKFAISLMDNLDFETASVYFADAMPDTQYMLLELFETLLFYPDDYVSTLASGKVKWKEFMLKIPQLMDKRLNKKFISLASHYFSMIRTDSEGKYTSILNTSIIKALVRIFENSKYSIKLQIIDCLNILIKSDTDVALDSIVTHNCINQIVPFLDDKSNRVLDFALQMILYILRFAQNENIQNKVIQQLDYNEFGPIIEEFCTEEHNQEISELADFVRSKYEEFSKSFDENQISSFSNQSPFFQGFGMNQNEDENENEGFPNTSINYDELSRNHQNPGFPTGFMMDYGEENENEGFPNTSINYDELSRNHQNPGFPTGFMMDYGEENEDDESQKISINYDELSRNHQNPGFPSFFQPNGFGPHEEEELNEGGENFNGQDEMLHYGDYEKFCQMNQNNESENEENENDNDNDNDNKEEEDIWIDADDVDVDEI